MKTYKGLIEIRAENEEDFKEELDARRKINKIKKAKNKDSLGCGKRFKSINGKLREVWGDCDFICGVPDGWGKETLCFDCDKKLRESWAKEDLKIKKEVSQ